MAGVAFDLPLKLKSGRYDMRIEGSVRGRITLYDNIGQWATGDLGTFTEIQNGK